jgi:hypothetical protein
MPHSKSSLVAEVTFKAFEWVETNEERFRKTVANRNATSNKETRYSWRNNAKGSTLRRQEEKLQSWTALPSRDPPT